MIRQFCSLSFVLLFGLLVWILYQRRTWDYDYTSHQFFPVSFPPLDSRITDNTDPSFFKNQTIISNDTTLRFPQDIAVSSSGIIYSGLLDGVVVALTPSTNSSEPIYNNNTEVIYSDPESGRIFGIIITSDDKTLYYVTENKGLVQLDIENRKANYLMDEIQGKHVGALNNLCIDEDNQIVYFTDSTPIRMTFAPKEMFLGHQLGRILSYNVKTGEKAVVLDKLAFPNGIVYEKKSHSLIFAELNRFKIWKYRLNEQKKDLLLVVPGPGFADNLKLSQDGHLLIGIPGMLDSLTHNLFQNPIVRKIAIYLPTRLVYALAKKMAGGLKVDTTTGQIVEYLFGAPTKINYVTSIVEKNGKLYFSCLKMPTIVVVDRNVQKSVRQVRQREEEL